MQNFYSGKKYLITQEHGLALQELFYGHMKTDMQAQNLYHDTANRNNIRKSIKKYIHKKKNNSGDDKNAA